MRRSGGGVGCDVPDAGSRIISSRKTSLLSSSGLIESPRLQFRLAHPLAQNAAETRGGFIQILPLLFWGNIGSARIFGDQRRGRRSRIPSFLSLQIKEIRQVGR